MDKDTTVQSRIDLDWPNRSTSRFVQTGNLRWHVQIAGKGPVLLLLHGTAASVHSWRDLLLQLAEHFTVVAPDLPSHGFTEAPPPASLSLVGMSCLVSDVLKEMGYAPVLAIGHSAGAAILIRMTLDGLIAPRGIVSLNGALLPFHGVAGQIFPALARLIFLNAWTPRIASSMATPKKVASLIAGTGSHIDERGMSFYTRLLQKPRHVGGALQMMANWDLRALQRDLPALETPVFLIVGETDSAVPIERSKEAAHLIPHARLEVVLGTGHLTHEEKPVTVADRIIDFAQELALIEEPQLEDLLRKSASQ